MTARPLLSRRFTPTMNRKQTSVILASSFLAFFACSSAEPESNGRSNSIAADPLAPPPAEAPKPEPAQNTALGEGLFAEIKTAKGTIVAQLEYALTPVTVASFVALAEGKHPYVTTVEKSKHFYDGLAFHRVAPDFVIQGGDPDGTGSGGPGYMFPEEIVPTLRHDKAGTMAMARTPARGSNGSQFYFTLKDTPFLDGDYTVFGHVVSGIDVVKAIQQGDKMESVKIVAKGKDAQAFDAVKVLEANKDKFKK